jgi:cation transport protein ChaC
MSALPLLNHSMRDADQMLERALAQWGGDEDLWIFGYGS